MATTSIKNFEVPSNGKIKSDKYVQMTIIATLIKLFAIKIVAKRRFGFSSRCKATVADLLLEFNNSSFSLGPIEKNATSDPETMADIKSKTINAIPKITKDEMAVDQSITASE